MKKLLLAFGLGTAAMGCYAQNSVTIYGIIDEGITYISNVKGKSNYVLDSGIMQGNRFGFKINEDLGNQVSVVAVLEYGFNLSSGAQSNPALRKSYVGLTSPIWGQVLLGRQYDPMDQFLGFDNLVTYAGIYSSSALDVDRLAGEAINNAATYTSPMWNGIKFGALYAFSNSSGAFGGTTGAPRWTGAAVSYDNQRNFSIAAGFTNVNGSGGSIAQQVTGATSQKVEDIGGRFVAGPAQFIASYRRAKLDGSPALGAITANEYEGAVIYRVKPDMQVILGYMQSVWTQGRWGTFTANYDYFLSKRTDVYVGATYQKSYSGTLYPSTVDVGGQVGAPGAINEAGASSNGRQLVLRVGMRTAF